MLPAGEQSVRNTRHGAQRRTTAHLNRPSKMDTRQPRGEYKFAAQAGQPFPFPFQVDSTLHLLTFTHKYPPFGEAQRKKKEGWYEQNTPVLPPISVPGSSVPQCQTITVLHSSLHRSQPSVFFHGYTSTDLQMWINGKRP